MQILYAGVIWAIGTCMLYKFFYKAKWPDRIAQKVLARIRN